jgi:hypothetical protein
VVQPFLSARFREEWTSTPLAPTWPVPARPWLLVLHCGQMGFCDKWRMDSEAPSSSHRSLAWFDIWSQSENYADFLQCILLLWGCDMFNIYPKKQKWIGIFVRLVPPKKKKKPNLVFMIFAPCKEHLCLIWTWDFTCCLYPTTKYKMSPIHYSLIRVKRYQY